MKAEEHLGRHQEDLGRRSVTQSKAVMVPRTGYAAIMTLLVLAACWTQTQGQSNRYYYYYNNPDLVMAGRCTCKDTDGNSVTFGICTPTRGGPYNQCTGCGMGNILPKCQASAKARGLSDTCTDYTSFGCALSCDDGGCRPNSCYRGNC